MAPPIVDVLAAADWSFPVPIAYGPGRIAEVGERCRRLGSERPLVVTDRGSVDLPFVTATVEALRKAGLAPALFADVNANPTDRNVAAGVAAFRSGDRDAVVAIGGGSGMDAGKSISLVAPNDTELWAFDYDNATVPQPRCRDRSASAFAPLICIPTTAGTGAETESTAMVTDTERGTKRCVWFADHKPALAILDPELTLTLPTTLTAWTGVDALVHAIEAYSVPAWNPLCDGLALEAMALIATALPAAVHDGADLEARGRMLVASCLAGVAFLKGLGLVHAMSHMVGAVHDTHHGLTNAVLLPTVLRFNRESLGEKADVMAEVVRADSIHTWVDGLLDRLDIPTGLAAIGVTESSLGELAIKSAGDAAASTNPRPATIAQIEGLLRESMLAARQPREHQLPSGDG